MRKDKRLKRNVANKILGGVCSGVADYFDIDVVLVRAIVASSILFAGVGLGLYIILWFFLPEEL
jgi:phage shock protein PspC (stress-responsive transcriptional regulator)